MDIEKIMYTLGAALPVIVVGSVITLSKITDPPEEYIKPPEFIKPPRTSEEESRLEIARDLCSEGAQILITYMNDLVDLAEAMLGEERPEEIAKELERIAKFIEVDFRKLSDRAEAVGKTMPQVMEAVKSTFPPKLGSDLAEYFRYLARYIVETRPDSLTIHDSLEILSDIWVKRALDEYCECLRKAGVACTS
jgi:hypothetical protein